MSRFVIPGPRRSPARPSEPAAPGPRLVIPGPGTPPGPQPVIPGGPPPVGPRRPLRGEPYSPRPEPVPTAPPTPVVTPTPEGRPQLNKMGEVLGKGTPEERFPVYLTKSLAVDQVVTPRIGLAALARYRVLSKEKTPWGMWRYEFQPATLFRGRTPPASEEEYFQDALKFVTGFEAMARPPDSPVEAGGGGLALRPGILDPPPPQFYGRPEDVLGANLVSYNVYETLRAFYDHMEKELPDSISAYEELMYQASASGVEMRGVTTLSEIGSLTAALNQFAADHPDDYTQVLNTEDGAGELAQLALRYYLTSPNRIATNPRELVLFTAQEYIPDIPFLKETAMRTLESLTDPVFVGSMLLFPELGMVTKGRLLLELAAGAAVGEQITEAAGLPSQVGALAGMVIAPSATRAAIGFERALLKASLHRARVNPVAGEPATELLVRNGQVLELPELQQRLDLTRLYKLPTKTLQTVERGENIVYSAHYADEAEVVLRGKTRGGLVWTTRNPATVMNVGEADAQVLTLRVKPGAKAKSTSKPGQPEAQSWAPEDLEPLSRMRLDEVYPPDIIAQGKPASRTPAFASEAAVARMGRAEGQTLVQFFRDLIRINIERPEAQDMLRLLGRKATFPGAKQLTEVTNRQVLAEAPAAKAGFGYEAMRGYDDALRRAIMANFKGYPVPFRWNRQAQVWWPDAPASKTGKWIAQGEIFEGIMRRDPAIMKVATQEQVQWVDLARKARDYFVRQAEEATGQKIAKRNVHWPRTVIDIPRKMYTVGTGMKGKPSSLHQRVVENQEEAVSKYGIHYQPNPINELENHIASLQRLTADVTLHKYLKEEGIITLGRGPTRTEVFAAPDIVPTIKGLPPGVISIEHLNEIKALTGPGLTGRRWIEAGVTIPQKVNASLRLLLAGSADTGVGTLQLVPLFFVAPEKWGEAMARSFYNALIEPKQFYRYLLTSPEAREFIRYGGNVGLASEFTEALRMAIPRPTIPEGLQPVADIATFPIRTLISRMQTEFDSALAYGRIMAFDAMQGPATAPGMLLRAAGARPLEGQAYHDEMFRLARFTDTLLGQPELRGIIPRTQQQFESAYLWFAPRYTRSLLGTMSYAFGKGYTPAQARVILGKMLLGGMFIHMGIVAGVGRLQGKSADEIISELKTTLDPRSGKAFMSKKVGKDWYGMGGVYRAGWSALGMLSEADNWRMETWRERTFDNPFVRIWRSRTTPVTGTAMDFLEGEDFIGREINFWDMVDDPRQFQEYAKDRYAPFTVNAILQEGDWQRRTTRGVAEFFGLRTSPETAWEAILPVMNRVAQERWGVDFEDGLEHNMPAQDWVRNHTSVKAVEEGRGGGALTRAEEKKWNLFQGLRDGIRDKYEGQKDDMDAAFYTGRITGADYREAYRVLSASEFSELLGSREALFKSLGLELGDEEAPAGTVDAALAAYFDTKVEDYKDKETQQVDWDSFFADRDAALASVPPEFMPLVNDYLTRHQARIARDFRKKFDSVIKPSYYFEMREQVAEALGIPLNDLENAIIQDFREQDRRAAPADVGAIVEDVLNAALERQHGASITIDDLKNKLRERNPELDLELYRQGYVSTVRSLGAVMRAMELKESSPEMGYFIPKLAADIERALQLAPAE